MNSRAAVRGRVRRARALLGIAFLAGCAATPIPPVETDYYREQLAAARTAAPAVRGTEGLAIREAAEKLEGRAARETERARRGDEAAGLIDLDAPGAREFAAKAADPSQAESVLGGAPLDLDHVLLAVHARNPDVAAARRQWAAAARMYEQATYLEDLLLRYSAFTRFATPSVGAAPMREAAFPYPGVVALKGEMIDREVEMAREMVRMRLRDAIVAAARAYHEIAHHVEELAIREEQVEIGESAVAAARARVVAGTGPQAELLEMETDLAMAQNDRAHAITSLARRKAELNTLMDRAPDSPVEILSHDDPPAETPARAPLLEMARRFAPEVRIAHAEVARTAAAIRMSEAMLFAAPAPGAVAAGAAMGARDAMGGAPAPGASMEPPVGDGGMTMGAAAQSAPAAAAPPLPPRDAPPSGSPGALAADIAWVAEMRERHASLVLAEAEAIRATERRVVEAHYELDSARRMLEVAAKTAEPLSAQAVEEQTRLYAAGRAMFDDLAAAIRRRLAAAHDAAQARHDVHLAEAMLWMAIGARPEFMRHAKEEGR